MQKFINGVRYDTLKATAVADDRFWDGSNFERHGRNTYLFKTAKGRFFKYVTTLWQGERNNIVSLTLQEAQALYESLPEQHLDYAQTFGTEPEEA